MKQIRFLRAMLAGIRREGFSCRAAWVGVNEKNLENQKRRLRLPSAKDGTTFLRFSCFFQSLPERMFIRAGGMKRSTGCHFLHTFFACPAPQVGRQTKKYEKYF